jgi:hypothetical protein
LNDTLALLDSLKNKKNQMDALFLNGTNLGLSAQGGKLESEISPRISEFQTTTLPPDESRRLQEQLRVIQASIGQM